MRTPIVALTANVSTEDREACLAAGMDGFLVKPLDRERLAAVLAASSTSSLAA
jgi:CheY-like chemotaxis protein